MTESDTMADQIWRVDYEPPAFSVPVFSDDSRHYFAARTAPGEFADDVLGDGFSYTTYPLQRVYANQDEVFHKVKAYDGHGPVPLSQPVLSMVRYRPHDDPGVIPLTPKKPRFVALYIHGWNDYFYHRELARHYALAGGAFFALDLHNYGRSLAPGQEPGWTTDLRSYGSEMSVALRVVRKAYPGLPIVLQGHSTGGLTAALWAHAFEGQLAGLVLNSPWLEMQTGEASRHLMKAALLWLRSFPYMKVASEDPASRYGGSFQGWRDQYGPLPPQLEPWRDDPSVAGCPLIQSWKKPEGRTIRAAWLEAIIDGHYRVAEGLNIDCPVLVQASSRSSRDREDRKASMNCDVVLDADLIEQRATNIGPDVHIKRLMARHDIMCSFPPARQEFFRTLHSWLYANVPASRVKEPWTDDTVYHLDKVPQGVLDNRDAFIAGLPPYCVNSICP